MLRYLHKYINVDSLHLQIESTNVPKFMFVNIHSNTVHVSSMARTAWESVFIQLPRERITVWTDEEHRENLNPHLSTLNRGRKGQTHARRLPAIIPRSFYWECLDPQSQSYLMLLILTNLVADFLEQGQMWLRVVKNVSSSSLQNPLVVCKYEGNFCTPLSIPAPMGHWNQMDSALPLEWKVTWS